MRLPHKNFLQRWQMLLLALVLVFGQALVAAHEISHATGASQDGKDLASVCATCLALSGIQGAPPPAHAPLQAPTLADVQPEQPLPPLPCLEVRAPYRSRAPPVFPS